MRSRRSITHAWRHHGLHASPKRHLHIAAQLRRPILTDIFTNDKSALDMIFHDAELRVRFIVEHITRSDVNHTQAGVGHNFIDFFDSTTSSSFSLRGTP
jgi:hypothetical protein